jgi:hypothetical protein
LGVDKTRPAGSASVKATLVSATAAFGLLIVKLKVVVPTTPMAAAPNALMMVGGATAGGVVSTVREVVEVFPVPPFVDVTVTLLPFTPAVVPVTLTEKVQEAPAAKVAPERATLPEPATAVIVPPPQLPARPSLGVDTTRPAASVSVKATPVSGTAAFGLLIVKLKVVVPPTPMAAAPNFLMMVGEAMKLALHWVIETMLLSSVTAPVCASALPDTLAAVFRVMLVSARMFPMNEVVVPRTAELPTCQNTLQGDPPLIMFTDELLAVVRVLTILKMKTALALPWASRVTVPVN